MALLRGTLKLEEGELVWSGKWAYNAEQFKDGEKERFSLKAPAGDGDVPPKGETTFSGFFGMKKKGEDGTEKKIKVKEEVELSFEANDKGYAVSGDGYNKFGNFSVEGTLFTDGNKISCKKTYVNEDDDESDFSDDDAPAMDADEIAEELADLREDALEQGLVLPGEQAASSSNSERQSKKRKRADGSAPSNRAGDAQAPKKQTTEKPEGGGSTEPAKPPDSDDVGAKMGSENPTVQVRERLPVSTEPWTVDALTAKAQTLQKAVDANDEKAILQALEELRTGGVVSIAQLQSTGVGKAVRVLKKHASEAVKAAALEIVNQWKEMVKKEEAAVASTA